MKQILLILTLLLYSYIGSGQQKPNIVLFFVDDLGWADLGYRNEKLHTPNIDDLKDEGMDFSRAYIATPTCSPSRASLLTGREPARLQMVRHIPHNAEYGSVNGRFDEEFHIWDTDPAQMPSRNWLPLEESTYAERLKELGYYNIFIGKWHLGHEPYHPVHQGFDEQYGASNFGHPGSYYQPFFKQPNPLDDVPENEYLTDALSAKAESFIRNYDKAQPFMLSLWYYNVHGPHIGRKDLVEQYIKEGLEGKYAEYAAMISAVDGSVGRIRRMLKEKGMAENTVLLFLSDQGGYFINPPFKGGKTGGSALYEGGARVPLIAYYPGVIIAGSTCDVPVQSIDIYPTLIEIASGKKYRDRGINGRSLMPIFEGKKMKERNLYFFRSYEDQYAAVLLGDWKLIKYHSGKFELFNLKNDIGEEENLIEKEIERASHMQKDLAKWEQEALKN